MTSVATPPTPDVSPKAADFDPEQYRMTIGEHLEELRRRMVLGLVGFLLAGIFCLIFGQEVVSYFCQPLVNALEKAKVSPQIYITKPGDGFIVFMQISLICAGVIAAPWMIYQIWAFIAAGLYPHERKYITKYVPLSITLLIVGWLFVYFLVLPWTLQFFLGFAADIPLYPGNVKKAPIVQMAEAPKPSVPFIKGDPDKAPDGYLWFDTTQERLKMMLGGIPRVVPFGPSNLIAPHITLPEYIDLVTGMLLVFGLAFQLPLVVLALLRIGIVELKTMANARKYVYFAMTVLSAMITPGDVITATIAMVIPLCLLFELGIVLFKMGNRKTVMGGEEAQS